MYRQSHDIFNTHLTRVKVQIKTMIIFDLEFDQDQIIVNPIFHAVQIRIPLCFPFFPSLFKAILKTAELSVLCNAVSQGLGRQNKQMCLQPMALESYGPFIKSLGH